jgi:lipopolysaccharide/colanic/teichoic acid biosynthesis glycosyltransferase
MIRFLDLIFSLFGSILLLPLLLIVGIAIRTESTGSAIFRQKRIGKAGAEFSLYKFRTKQVKKDDNRLRTPKLILYIRNVLKHKNGIDNQHKRR